MTILSEEATVFCPQSLSPFIFYFIFLSIISHIMIVLFKWESNNKCTNALIHFSSELDIFTENVTIAIYATFNIGFYLFIYCVCITLTRKSLERFIVFFTAGLISFLSVRSFYQQYQNMYICIFLSSLCFFLSISLPPHFYVVLFYSVPLFCDCVDTVVNWKQWGLII